MNIKDENKKYMLINDFAKKHINIKINNFNIN